MIGPNILSRLKEWLTNIGELTEKEVTGLVENATSKSHLPEGFNKTIVLLVFDGYQMILTNSVGKDHLISSAPSRNTC